MSLSESYKHVGNVAMETIQKGNTAYSVLREQLYNRLDVGQVIRIECSSIKDCYSLVNAINSRTPRLPFWKIKEYKLRAFSNGGYVYITKEKQR